MISNLGRVSHNGKILIITQRKHKYDSVIVKRGAAKMKKAIILLALLSGCAKSASETATEAALAQTGAIYQTIKKECPTAKIDEQIAALKATIQNQLASCEAEKGKLRERNNTLLAILIGLIAVIVAVNWLKIKTKIFRHG